jgi:hypothetical protein
MNFDSDKYLDIAGRVPWTKAKNTPVFIDLTIASDKLDYGRIDNIAF